MDSKLRAELKELINEVLDEREQFRNTSVTFPLTNETFNQDISINTEGMDVITFT